MTDEVAQLKFELEAAKKRESDTNALMIAYRKQAKDLQHAGVNLALIGRSWVMVWGDVLSPFSIEQFNQIEREFLLHCTDATEDILERQA